MRKKAFDPEKPILVQMTQKEVDILEAFLSGVPPRTAWAKHMYPEAQGDERLIREHLRDPRNRNRVSQFFRRQKSQAYLAWRNQQIVDKHEVTRDWWLQKLKTVVDRCMQEKAVLDHHGKKTGEYRFDSSGAARALEQIGRHLGVYERDNAQKTVGKLKALQNAIEEVWSKNRAGPENIQRDAVGSKEQADRPVVH